MIGRFAVAFVLIAVPVFGQSRVYTNADLGKIQRTHNATEEELAGLRAHQFVLVPNRPAGPEVIVVHGSTAEGPFGPFYTTAREPLGWMTIPAAPFYGGYYGIGRGAGRIMSVVPNLSAPPRIIVPPSVRAPAAAGHPSRRR